MRHLPEKNLLYNYELNAVLPPSLGLSCPSALDSFLYSERDFADRLDVVLEMIHVPKLLPSTASMQTYLELTTPLCTLSSLQVHIVKVVLPNSGTAVTKRLLFESELPVADAVRTLCRL